MALPRRVGKFSLWIAIAGALSLPSLCGAVVAASQEDAHVRIKENVGGAVSWELGNSRIEIEVTYVEGNLLLTRLYNPATNSDWTPPREFSSISQDLRFRIRGRDFELMAPSRGDAVLLSSHEEFLDNGSPTLALSFRRTIPPRFQFTVFVQVHPGSLVQMWSEFQNRQPTGEGVIEVFQAGGFRLPVSARQGEWKIAHVNTSAYKEPFAVEWVPLAPGAVRDQPFHGSTHIKTYFLKREEEEALIGGPLFGHRSPIGFGIPGQVRFSRADGATVSVEITQDQAKAPVSVKEGQYLRGPGYVLGFSGPELSTAASLYQDLTLRFLSPPPPAAGEDVFPWIEYNAYFGYDLGFSARVLKRDVDLAAALGAEVFIIDAGWQIGSLEKCEIVREFSDYLVSAGEYRLDDKSRFPQEEIPFRDFARYVHAKGLRFGLWFCPFNVDPHRKTDWHRKWLSRDARVLCAADREAADWIFEKISGIVNDYHVDFLKFDCQASLTCSNPAHDTTRSVGEKIYAIPAYYGYSDLIHRLRSRFPRLSIEANPNLGHVQASTDDFDLSPASGRAELYKARFHNPPRYTAQYLMLEPPAEKGWTPDEYLHHMKTVIRSNMMGHVILSSELTSWRPRFRTLVKEHLDIYKRFRRILNGTSTDLFFDTEWEVTQFQDPAQRGSLLFLFRNRTNDPVKRVFPKGLSRESTYSVSYADGRQETHQVLGSELMDRGLGIELEAPQSSEIVFLLAANATDVDVASDEIGYDPPCRDQLRNPSSGDKPEELKRICAPLLESSGPGGWTVVYRNGSDFNPDTYDLGFDPNLGDVHLPLDRIGQACPSCKSPEPSYCRPGVWNCRECPKLMGVPGHPDSDLDGLPNWWEEIRLGNLVPGADEDGDGLDNLTEYRHLTDPLVADTDGDGWSDALELASFGTDPLLPDKKVQFLFVDPGSECVEGCGSRAQPFPDLAGALSIAAEKERTLILLGGRLVQSPSDITIPSGSLVGVYGGFEAVTWKREGPQTHLENPGMDPISFHGSDAGSHLVLENLSFSGGLRIEGSGRSTLARLTVSQAESQAGLEVEDLEPGMVILSDSLIRGNGSGVVARNSRVVVQNCTILNNREAALQEIIDPEGGGHLTSVNNILSGNGRDLTGVRGVYATACDSDPRCVRLEAGALIDQTNLLPAQPLWDSGVSVEAFSTHFDWAGHPRRKGLAIDLGAVEVQDRGSPRR